MPPVGSNRDHQQTPAVLDPTSPAPDPPVADIETVRFAETFALTIIALAAIAVIAFARKFFLIPRSFRADPSSGMIHNAVIREHVKKALNDVTTAKVHYNNTQQKLREARSVRANIDTRVRSGKAMKAFTKRKVTEIGNQLDMANTTLFLQQSRHQAWAELLDRLEDLDRIEHRNLREILRENEY
ncbi:hypothetical protein ACHAO9_012214 [Fusarium lateritium]